MARTITLGNHRLFIALDVLGDVRELCWPLVGSPNHLAGNRIRLGVWIDGDFSWLSSESWSRKQSFEPQSNTGTTNYESHHLGITIAVSDVVERNRDCWHRDVQVTNLRNHRREIRLFQSQCLKINETDIGDTAFFHSSSDSVVHFKQDVWLALSGKSSKAGIFQYATGLAGLPEWDGTWRDAEDGELAGKPIEQGSVDSTFSVRDWVEPGETAEFSINFNCGHLLEDVVKPAKREPSREQEIEPAIWIDSPSFSPEVRRLLHASLSIVKAHTGSKGQIIAAIDSDIMESNRSNYGYVWMRDACLTGRTMAELGDPNTRKLLDFLPETENDNFLWQKYNSDGTRGSTWHPHTGSSLPYQLDETALTIWHYCHLLQGAPDQRGAERVIGWTNLLADSIDAEGRPPSGWDLWEEREGIHFWTVATILEALRTAEAAFPEHSPKWHQAREKLDLFVQEHFLGHDSVPRRLFLSNGQWTADETVDASSLAGAMFYKEFPRSLVTSSYESVKSHLLTETHVRGVARYEGDYYCRVREGYPGNPWIVCTMWLARAEVMLGLSDGMEWLEWATRHALETYALPEQIHPDTGEPLSVCPLVWSHAEVLETARLIARGK
ncbi:hypothetical protein QPK87_19630 [Kamptonema cortianum]|nr:hypothetical protein [Geitlerinema splendidum]MDK3158768.1 hypothetical protein [Kamptonema cortianum]